MADLWYPGGIRDEAPRALWGTHTPGARPKFLLHTTEGPLGVYRPDPREGDARRYWGHTSWPTYTLAQHDRKWRVYCHIPANHSARALANRAGGVETNRGGASQVEIAARAAVVGLLPGEALEELARLLAWEHEARGVPIVSSVRWVAHPASYGEHAPQRLSGAAWDAYAGVLGHQHAPENDHGDPGAFPVGRLLSRAREIAGEDDIGVTAMDEIAERVLSKLREQVFDVTPPIRQGNAGHVIGATYNKVGDVQSMLGRGDGSVLAYLQRIEGFAQRIEGFAYSLSVRDAELMVPVLRDAEVCDRLAALFSARADELRGGG